MIKKLFTILPLLTALVSPVFGQRYDGTVTALSGAPVPYAAVAVCTQPATTSTTPCSPLATLYTSSSLSTTAPNPLSADAHGNFHFYADPTAGPFTVQYYGATITTPLVLADQLPNGGPALLTSGGALGGTFSGDPTFSGNPLFTGSLTLANGKWLQWKDPGGLAQTIMRLDTSDNLSIYSPQDITIQTTAVGHNVNITPGSGGSSIITNLKATGGGSLSGTFTGSPTLSGSPAFTGGAALSGTFSGDPYFSGSPTTVGNGTSGQVALPVLAGQVFNIKAYGALGDGMTNDSPAVQSAYAAAVSAGGGIVYFPPTSSCYLLGTTINATNDGHKIMFMGGGGGAADSSNQALLCGNTGAGHAIFDITMGYNRTFFDLSATATKSGLSSPSTIGIIAGRNTSGQSGQNNFVYDCQFQLPLHTSGSTYSFGVYYFGEEMSDITDSNFSADYPIVLTSSNTFGLASSYVTFGTGTTYSETAVHLNHVDLYTDGLGPGVWLYGAYDIKISGHVYNGSQANPYPAGLYNYAIYSGSNSYLPNHDIDVKNFRQEGFPGFMYVDGGLQSSSIEGTDAPAPSPALHGVEFNGASSDVRDMDFRIYDEMSASSNFYYDATAGSPVGLWSLDSVHFYCGIEPNCVDIPLGQGSGSGAAYWRNVSWSKSAASAPVIDVGIGSTALPLTGGFSISTSDTVPASGCLALASVAASGGPANSYVEIHPQMWQGLLVTAEYGTGTITPKLCNFTTAPITVPYAIGATFRISQ